MMYYKVEEIKGEGREGSRNIKRSKRRKDSREEEKGCIVAEDWRQRVREGDDQKMGRQEEN